VFSGIYLKPYNETADDFGSYITTNTSPLITGKGYAAWADVDSTVVFTGSPNNGTVGPVGCSRNNQGYNLVGNPFPCTINWDATSGWTKTNLADATWIWNPTSGQYATYINGIAANGGNRLIATGQGFFVQASGAGASLTMTRSIILTSLVSFKKPLETDSGLVRIGVSGAVFSDECVVGFREAADNGFDYTHDATKMFGSVEAPQLYSVVGDRKLAINIMNPQGYAETVPLGVSVDGPGQYTLVIRNSAGKPCSFADIRDGVVSMVTDSISYVSDLTAADTAGRFELRFDAAAATLISRRRESGSLVNCRAGHIVLGRGDETVLSARIVSVDGRSVWHENTVRQGTTVVPMKKGMYVVTVKTADGIERLKTLSF